MITTLLKTFSVMLQLYTLFLKVSRVLSFLADLGNFRPMNSIAPPLPLGNSYISHVTGVQTSLWRKSVADPE